MMLPFVVEQIIVSVVRPRTYVAIMSLHSMCRVHVSGMVAFSNLRKFSREFCMTSGYLTMVKFENLFRRGILS